MKRFIVTSILLLLFSFGVSAQTNKIDLQHQVKNILPFGNGGLGTASNPTAFKMFGNCTGSTASPSFCTLVSGNLPGTVVYSTSPGAGIAHFAGSTQFLTSSPVSLTADVSGILPEGNLPATTVFTDQSATFGAHTYDFSAGTLFRARLSAGLTTSTTGDFGYDTTNNNWHGYNNGSDLLFAEVPIGTAVNADCPIWVVSSGNVRLGDSGGACGGSGANVSLSNLSAVSINASLLAQAGVDLGSTADPLRNLYLYGSGTYGSTYIELTGTPTGTRVLTLPNVTDTLVGRTTTDTLTNKTLTAPVIATIVNSGTLTLPTSTDTLVGRATTDTLTNKTLTAPVIATIVNTGTLTLPTSTDTLVGRATTDTLTNKTLTSPVLGGTPDASGATQFKLPVGAGFATAANGEMGYDTTNKNWHGWNNGSDLLFTQIPIGTAVNNDCPIFVVSASNVRLGDSGAGCGSVSGTQYASTYYATTTTLGGVTPPATPGFYILGYNVPSSSAVAPTATLAGLADRDVSGSTDTVLFSDNGNAVIYESSSAVAVALPTPTSLGNPAFVSSFVNRTTGSTTAVTFTSAGGLTINGSATYVLKQGQSARFSVDGSGSWEADGYETQIAAGTGITLTRTAYGLSIASSGGTPALSSISAATGSNTVANGNNGAQVWNWAQTSNSQTAFTFGETTAATGTSDLELVVKTLAGSTAIPLSVLDSLTGSQTIPAESIGCTWNTTGVVDACLLVNVTNTASGAASKLFDAQVGGTSQFSVDKGGNVLQLGTLGIGTSPPACSGGTGSAWCGTEGTIVSTGPASGVDVNWDDSTNHCTHANWNNTDMYCLATVINLATGTPTITKTANATSAACASGYTCTNARGEITIVGGTATTGTIATVNFSTTLGTAPGLCIVTQDGGATLFGIGHGTPSTSSFTITAAISIVSSTLTVDYSCQP